MAYGWNNRYYAIAYRLCDILYRFSILRLPDGLPGFDWTINIIRQWCLYLTRIGILNTRKWHNIQRKSSLFGVTALHSNCFDFVMTITFHGISWITYCPGWPTRLRQRWKLWHVCVRILWNVQKRWIWFQSILLFKKNKKNYI